MSLNLLELLSALSSASGSRSESVDCDCGSESCHVNSRAVITKCPATKTEIREFSYEFDVDELCRELQIDPATVDKRLFQTHSTVQGKITRDHNSVNISISTPLGGKACTLLLTKISQRVDTLQSNLATSPACSKYTLMAAEDAMALEFFKRAYGALLKSPKATLDNLSGVYLITLLEQYGAGATCAAKKKQQDAFGKTLRIIRSATEEVIPALLDEVERAAVLLKTITVRTLEDSQKWTKFAIDYVNADAKKKQDKKEKEEAETKERLVKEAAKRAEEAAALKLKLGNPTLAEQAKSDSI